MTELRLEDVSKVYRTGGAETTALRDVDLRVRDGEFFTLVGPSGCGKTTTLRTIAGFEAPSSGRVTFDGTDVTATPPEERDVGVVFQSYALFPHMSVAENVAYGLQFRDAADVASRERRVEELLELVDLEGMGDRSPDQLSGGQQQRVALARALAPEPSLLLLDEPMSALDARLRETLRRQVRRIQSDLEITTVYVTHDQAEALAISDRLAVMNGGRLEQVGTPQELYRRPGTRFVAEFVGDNNVFEGTAVDGGVADGNAPDVGAADGDGAANEAADGVGATSEPANGAAPGSATETVVRVDGHRFRLETAAAVTSGDRVTFCVRPEALSSAVGTNRLEVAVETSEFLGDAVRVHGRWTDDGAPIVLRTDDVPEDDPTVGFDPSDAHVIAVE